MSSETDQAEKDLGTKRGNARGLCLKALSGFCFLWYEDQSWRRFQECPYQSALPRA